LFFKKNVACVKLGIFSEAQFMISPSFFETNYDDWIFIKMTVVWWLPFHLFEN